MELRLNCKPCSDLNWDSINIQSPTLWHLDFGRLDLTTVASAERALNYFLDTVDPQLITSVRLYEGAPEEDLPDYLDRLVALLPDEIPATAKFDLTGIQSKAEAARLTSTERYPWILVENRENQDAILGLLFPLEELCIEENLKLLDAKMAEIDRPFRIVYEYNFTESWNGLDEIIVFDQMLSPLGERKLQGFTITGGKRISG